MGRTNETRRWQRSESKLLAQVDALEKQRAAMLVKADRVRDWDAKRQMWQGAQRLEDPINTIKGRLRRLRARQFEEKQPSLFDS